LVTWSADVVADDWKCIGAREIVRRTMRRLEEKGRGILLFHDIHATTAAALPILLKELKERLSCRAGGGGRRASRIPPGPSRIGRHRQPTGIAGCKHKSRFRRYCIASPQQKSP
jgi:hypothetical protein